MKLFLRVAFSIMALMGFLAAAAQKPVSAGLYISNRAPLVQQKYIPLPLGSIKPGGICLKCCSFSAMALPAISTVFIHWFAEPVTVGSAVQAIAGSAVLTGSTGLYRWLTFSTMQH